MGTAGKHRLGDHPQVGTAPEPGPLYVLAGAQAAGKTTLLPHLVRLARGPIVMEMDEILEDGALLGVPVATPEAEPIWPAYDRMWMRILSMVRRAGHPVVLLCPTPSPDNFPTGSIIDQPVSWALLDCSDRVRRARLRERGWSRDQIEEFLADPVHDRVRALIPTIFRTDDEEPASVAVRVLHWVANSRTPSG